MTNRAFIRTVGQCFQSNQGGWTIKGWAMGDWDGPLIDGTRFCGWELTELARIAAQFGGGTP